MKVKMEYLIEVHIYSWFLYLYHVKLTPGLVDTNCTGVKEGQDLEMAQTNQAWFESYCVSFLLNISRSNKEFPQVEEQSYSSLTNKPVVAKRPGQLLVAGLLILRWLLLCFCASPHLSFGMDKDSAAFENEKMLNILLSRLLETGSMHPFAKLSIPQKALVLFSESSSPVSPHLQILLQRLSLQMLLQTTSIP